MRQPNRQAVSEKWECKCVIEWLDRDDPNVGRESKLSQVKSYLRVALFSRKEKC